MRRPGRGERATSTVVGKALEAGLVVLFVGLLTAVLFGNVVPTHRAFQASVGVFGA